MERSEPPDDGLRDASRLWGEGVPASDRGDGFWFTSEWDCSC